MGARGGGGKGSRQVSELCFTLPKAGMEAPGAMVLEECTPRSQALLITTAREKQI